MQTNEFQADAKIRAVFDYFMGLIQRRNKRLVSFDRLVSLETRATVVLLKKLSFRAVLTSQIGYPNNLRYSPCLCLQIHMPTFS